MNDARQRGAAEQHREQHAAAIGQVDFDLAFARRPAAAACAGRSRRLRWPPESVTSRSSKIGALASITCRCRCAGAEPEPDPRRAAFAEPPLRVDVQRRTARAGVDLGAHRARCPGPATPPIPASRARSFASHSARACDRTTARSINGDAASRMVRPPFVWAARCTGAGEGNRTLVSSLGSYSSTIELRPRRAKSMPRVATWQCGSRTPASAATASCVSAARHQKLPPKVTNTLASLPPPCATVALTPMLASSPNTCVRAPTPTCRSCRS